MITIEVSPGEVIDRLTILTIKSERLADQAKLKGVHTALGGVNTRVAERFDPHVRNRLWPLYERLKAVNEAIWDAEEEIRRVDWSDTRAVATLARRLHENNDRRFRIKKEIDGLMDCDMAEVKSYL